MALFRSNRGMHLLALPTTHADAENTRRKNIQDGGTTTASRLLAQARVLPQEALVCGSPGRRLTCRWSGATSISRTRRSMHRRDCGTPRRRRSRQNWNRERR